jgi:hypothetical protein
MWIIKTLERRTLANCLPQTSDILNFSFLLSHALLPDPATQHYGVLVTLLVAQVVRSSS